MDKIWEQQIIKNFAKYARRQDLARFLARYELFKKIINVKGSIVECGVHEGSGVFSWAKLSSNLEPYSIHRKIIGFDTFEGFPDIDKKDLNPEIENEKLKKGGFSESYDVFSECNDLVAEYDANRFLNQFDKIRLVKGDALSTIPEFVSDNKYLTISLLFLDFDLYAPTKTALQYLAPLVVKGGIIAFDEVNNENWPGESEALKEFFGNNLNQIELKKFYFDPNISYFIV